MFQSCLLSLFNFSLNKHCSVFLWDLLGSDALPSAWLLPEACTGKAFLLCWLWLQNWFINCQDSPLFCDYPGIVCLGVGKTSAIPVCQQIVSLGCLMEKRLDWRSRTPPHTPAPCFAAHRLLLLLQQWQSTVVPAQAMLQCLAKLGPHLSGHLRQKSLPGGLEGSSDPRRNVQIPAGNVFT